jgi:branched-chain amino acid aminotransferase
MYYNNDTIIYFDGEFVKVNETKLSVYNHTLHYGNGVFEGIRAYDTSDGVRVFKAKEHFQRLIYSANSMGFDCPLSIERLEAVCYELLEKNKLKNAYIRPIITLSDNMSLNSNSKPVLTILAWEWGNYLGAEMLSVMLSSFQRPNPKSCFVEAKVVGHYTNSILATNEAKLKGFDEALLTDMHGFVAEGPGANFFYEKDGILYTAPLGNILAGITRATVFELAKELQIEVVEKLFYPDEIYQADTAFFCGTAAEIIGIKKFETHEFEMNWEDSSSALIQKMYKRRVSVNEYKNVFL